jgi:uncharacterized phage protein (TIGR01671 family)
MQYTGLKDKNSKEIYEGDIVKFEKEIEVVGWNDDHVGFRPTIGGFVSIGESDQWFNRLSDSEVIGNIYENKDLLK